MQCRRICRCRGDRRGRGQSPPKLAEIGAKSINYIGAGTPESNAIPYALIKYYKPLQIFRPSYGPAM